MITGGVHHWKRALVLRYACLMFCSRCHRRHLSRPYTCARHTLTSGRYKFEVADGNRRRPWPLSSRQRLCDLHCCHDVTDMYIACAAAALCGAGAAATAAANLRLPAAACAAACAAPAAGLHC